MEIHAENSAKWQHAFFTSSMNHYFYATFCPECGTDSQEPILQLARGVTSLFPEKNLRISIYKSTYYFEVDTT